MATNDRPGNGGAGSEAERHLSRPPSAGMYEAILEVAADAIVTINEAGIIVHFNHGAEQIFGYPKAEVLGTALDRLLPPQFRHSHHSYITAFGTSSESARLMGHRREVFGLRKDGTEFPAEASILKLDAPDGRRLYTALVRDVTDRKRRDEQQRFLSDVSAALGTSLDYAATLESVVRLPVPSLAGACELEIVDELGDLHRLTHGEAELLSNGTPATVAIEEFELMARGQSSGLLRLLRLRSSATRDAGDSLVAESFAQRASLAIDNARLYREARRATAARDDVLGVVSHDLRNPLCAIAMCSRVLMDTPPTTDDERRSLARNIHESTSWMSRMIQDLLDVAAIDAGVLSIVCAHENIEQVVTRSVALFSGAAAEKQVVIDVKVTQDLPPAWVDAERLVQAVANLLGNAVKFTPGGGRITIGVVQAGDAVEISVTDTGPGIGEADLPQIFNRFWHARASGGSTGLGLAIAKGIVNAHRGTVTVQSSVGNGSRFTIRIPQTSDAGVER